MPSTTLLAGRLAVRRRAPLATQVLLAGLFLVAALVLTSHALQRDQSPFLVLLGAAVAALLRAQLLLDRRVRRVDRRVGATLSRRATHPVHPGWRVVLCCGSARCRMAVTAFAFVIAGVVALVLVQVRATAVGAVAPEVAGVR